MKLTAASCGGILAKAKKHTIWLDYSLQQAAGKYIPLKYLLHLFLPMQNREGCGIILSPLVFFPIPRPLFSVHRSLFSSSLPSGIC